MGLLYLLPFYIGELISELESAELKLSSRKTGQETRHLVLGYTNSGRQVSVAVTFSTSAHTT